MAMQLIAKDRKRGCLLAESLLQVMEKVGQCRSCRYYTEDPICAICRDPHRDSRLLCIVESALDVMALESSNSYNGYYFVLHGLISPLDGIGPEHLGLPSLLETLINRATEEVIFATNATVEGEATVHYIHQLLQSQYPHPTPKQTRIAHGIPVGGELEMINSNTISFALSGRTTLTHPNTAEPAW